MQTTTFTQRLLLTIAAFWAVGVASGATLRECPLTAESLSTAVSDAKTLAARNLDMQVVRVVGQSMLPYFGEGAVLVVKPIAAAKLSVGMVVVYKNRFGETVAHRLVASASNGWVAKGYNNREVDSTLVNDQNLLGVVYATLHSNGQAAAGVDMVSAFHGTTLAMAAPAK